MKTIYGSTPEDGQIHCNVCGEYICDEDTSLVEGFSDDKPTSSRDVLIQETTDDLQREQYMEKNRKNASYITSIVSSIGLDADEEFVYEILKSSDNSDSNELPDLRYGLANVSNSDVHPRVTKKIHEIKGKEAKTKNKKERSELKSQREKVIVSFQKWLKDTNKLLMYVSLVAVFIQTAVPSLNIRKNQKFRVIDTKTGGFRTETLNYLEAKIKKLCEEYSKETFWANCGDLFNESKHGSNDLISQIKNTIIYVTTPLFPGIQKRVKLYDEFTKFEKKTFLRQEWVLFKPQSNNELNISVGDYLDKEDDKHLKRLFGGYLIENISAIRPLLTKDNLSLAKLCDIPTLEIVQNPAFQRLFRYTISCYGTHQNNVGITILIHQMLSTTEKSDSIKNILKQHGWNETSGGFKSIDFKVWREKIIPSILSLYGAQGSSQIKSCYSNEGSCNIFIHRLVNNYDYPILNTLPKRIYGYLPPVIYPEFSFKRLSESRPEFIKKLFDSYRINCVGDIVRYLGDDDYCDKWSLRLEGDQTIPKESMKTLRQDEENFHNLLTVKRENSTLPYIPVIEPKVTFTHDDYEFIKTASSTENRLLEWFKDYPSDTGSDDKIQENIQSLVEKHGIEGSSGTDDWPRMYRSQFSEVIPLQHENILKLSSFLVQSDDIGKTRRDRLASVFKIKYTSDNLVKILTTFLKDSPFSLLENYCQDIRRILIVVSERDPESSVQASMVNKMIPKEWKLTETVRKNASDFLVRGLLDASSTRVPSTMFLHDRQIDPRSKDIFSGFYSYRLGDEDTPLYLEGLRQYIDPYLRRISLLKGSINSLYTVRLSETYLRFHMSVVLIKIVSYIEGLHDSHSEIVRDANTLFLSLSQSVEEGIQRTIQTCSEFLMDLITHLLLTHYDPSWIYMNLGDELDKRLTKQKEREKGERIKQLDSAEGAQEREIMKAKQDAGLTNWWKEASDAAEKYVNSDDWRISDESERDDHLKAIFSSLGLDPENEQLAGLVNGIQAPTDEPEEIGYDYAAELEQDDEGDEPNGDLDEELDAVFNE